jgi:hypothetical protein
MAQVAVDAAKDEKIRAAVAKEDKNTFNEKLGS